MKSYFPKRSGWFIQQIIKLEFASRCPDGFVLVIDSDTILLRKLNWVDVTGRQILFESEEYHQPYFDFLRELGFESLTTNSHITHHMVYQPKIAVEMLSAIGILLPSDWIQFLNKTMISAENFASIDYEAYSQYLIANHPNLCTIYKWSNVPLARQNELLRLSFEEIQLRYIGFNSVSFHDWYE
jgi:hypothetical protein